MDSRPNFTGLQYHRLLLGLMAIILVAECDVAL
jgi:hypothetical protein